MESKPPRHMWHSQIWKVNLFKIYAKHIKYIEIIGKRSDDKF